MKFDYSSSLANDHIKYPQPGVTVDPKKGEQSHVKFASGIIFLWHIRYSDSRIKNAKTCKANISTNRVENSTAIGTCCITHDAKV